MPVHNFLLPQRNIRFSHFSHYPERSTDVEAKRTLEPAHFSCRNISIGFLDIQFWTIPFSSPTSISCFKQSAPDRDMGAGHNRDSCHGTNRSRTNRVPGASIPIPVGYPVRFLPALERLNDLLPCAVSGPDSSKQSPSRKHLNISTNKSYCIPPIYIAPFHVPEYCFTKNDDQNAVMTGAFTTLNKEQPQVSEKSITENNESFKNMGTNTVEVSCEEEQKTNKNNVAIAVFKEVTAIRIPGKIPKNPSKLKIERRLLQGKIQRKLRKLIVDRSSPLLKPNCFEYISEKYETLLAVEETLKRLIDTKCNVSEGEIAEMLQGSLDCTRESEQEKKDTKESTCCTSL